VIKLEINVTDMLKSLDEVSKMKILNMANRHGMDIEGELIPLMERVLDSDVMNLWEKNARFINDLNSKE